jgi:hypothetical protein
MHWKPLKPWIKMTEINVKIDVFPDPEFCESSHIQGDPDHKMCSRLVWHSGCCSEFRMGDKHFTKLAIGEKGLLIKCDQCKAAYQEAIKGKS